METGLLTPSEIRILQLAANGQRSKQIGEELNLNPDTVDTYRKAIVRKTGYNTLTQVVANAIREKWID